MIHIALGNNILDGMMKIAREINFNILLNASLIPDKSPISLYTDKIQILFPYINNTYPGHKGMYIKV